MKLSGLQRQGLNEAVAAYEKHVYEAADYLESRLISEEAALAHRLGVVREPLHGHERFVGMLCVPYLSEAGVLGLKFRQLQPDRAPKYDSPGGQRARLFNVAALHSPGDTVMVCEGELDAVVGTHVVGIPTVGIPGASHWQAHWARVWDDYDRVLIVADNDERPDGKNPGLRHARKIAKLIPNSEVVIPPPNEDLTSWVQRDGVEVVRDACGV